MYFPHRLIWNFINGKNVWIPVNIEIGYEKLRKLKNENKRISFMRILQLQKEEWHYMAWPGKDLHFSSKPLTTSMTAVIWKQSCYLGTAIKVFNKQKIWNFWKKHFDAPWGESCSPSSALHPKFITGQGLFFQIFTLRLLHRNAWREVHTTFGSIR